MNKNKNKKTCAIYTFPYFEKEPGFFRIFPIKALLAFVMCLSGAAYSNYLLNIKNGAALSVAAALISFLIFYTLLTFFKKRYSWLLIAAITGISLLFQRKEIFLAAKSFFYYLLKIADGEFIKTGWERYKNIDPFPFLIIIFIFFGIICAFSAVRRFYPEPVMLFVAMMSVPAFLSLSASFDISLAIYAAAVMGQRAVNSAATVNASLSAMGAYSYISGGQYQKNSAKMSLKKRVFFELQRYGKYLSDGFMVFIIILTIMGITASVFPKSGSIKFDGIIEGASKLFTNVGNWGDSVLNGFSAPAFNGFLSADGESINISGGLSPDNVKRKGVKVIEVITQNTDKIYLRGDVGFSFDGKGWKSIASLDYDSFESFLSYTGERYTVSQILNEYIPEIQYGIAYNALNAWLPSDLKLIKTQTVRVNYVRSMNTVLFPGTPFTYSFRENPNFSVIGDFVALVKKDRINSMETGVFYSTDDPIRYLESTGITKNDFDLFQKTSGIESMTFEQYLEKASSYQQFVDSVYTVIEAEDKKTIENFLKEIPTIALPSEELGADSDKNPFRYPPFMREEAANAILKQLLSGKYKYSLSADNFSGNKSPLYSFLYETKSGHCAMYASTMCLALRYLGIPARYATGFTSGGDNYKSFDGSEYTYELKDSDLHAWVEVYYNGFGWIPYDPTPPDTNPVYDSSIASQTASAPLTVTTPETTAESASYSKSETVTNTSAKSDASEILTSDIIDGTAGGDYKPDPQIIKIIFVFVIIAALISAAALSVRGVMKGLYRKQKNLLNFFKNAASNEAAEAMLIFMLKLLSIRKIERKAGETPEEFGKRTDKALGFSETLSKAIPIFEKSEFDKTPVFTSEEQEEVYNCVIKILTTTLDNLKPTERLFTRFKLFWKKDKTQKRQ